MGLRANMPENLSVLEGYADFWKNPHALLNDVNNSGTGLIFSAGDSESNFEEPIVISPTGEEDAKSIAHKYGAELSIKEDSMIKLPFSKDASVSIRTRTYDFTGPGIEPVIKSGSNNVLSKLAGKKIFLLSIDLVNAYRRLMRGIEDKPHRRFLIVSKLGAYTLIPQFIRNRAFKKEDGLDDLREDTIAPVECLRTIFLASLVKAAESPVPVIGFWRKGKNYALAVTHDVETQEGMESGVWRLLGVEEKFGIRSTWNVPSDRYPLSKDTISKLAKVGELGCHDTRHDGKLVLVRPDEQAKRLHDCKDSLEEASGQSVKGFRSPLLQHNSQLVGILSKAGYEFDSSIPSWEVLSPTSLGPHGVGTVFPFISSGIVEVPVSLPQDHQLLRVIGLSPADTSSTLLKFSNWIGKLGGACVLLVHPDYEYGQPGNEAEYQKLLESLARSPACDVMTLGGIARWWKFRERIQWKLEDGRPSSDESRSDSDKAQVRLATDYNEQNGFTLEDAA